jgi:hypothetical protein
MNICKRLCSAVGLLISTASVWAAPTSEFWTNCTTDVLDTGLLRASEVDYFTVFNKRKHGSQFPINPGLSYGLFAYKDIKCEVGVDYFGGLDDPILFNGKLGIEENKLFAWKWTPSFSVGIFNVGTRTRGAGRTNLNIVDIAFGHTLPEAMGGRIFIGAYSGSHALGKNRQGFMVAVDRAFCPTTYYDGTEYNKWWLVADYASGKNFIGGGGIGVFYYFTPLINLATGPVWFNDAHLLGKWKWSVQINLSVPICPKSV